MQPRLLELLLGGAELGARGFDGGVRGVVIVLGGVVALVEAADSPKVRLEILEPRLGLGERGLCRLLAELVVGRVDLRDERPWLDRVAHLDVQQLDRAADAKAQPRLDRRDRRAREHADARTAHRFDAGVADWPRRRGRELGSFLAAGGQQGGGQAEGQPGPGTAAESGVARVSERFACRSPIG